jgi:hypothetical protein
MATTMNESDILEIITQVQWYLRNTPQLESSKLVDCVITDCLTTFADDSVFYDRALIRAVARTALLTIQILEAQNHDN